MQWYMFYHVLNSHTHIKNRHILESCDFWKIDTLSPVH